MEIIEGIIVDGCVQALCGRVLRVSLWKSPLNLRGI